jgi:DivIVA domain-containing protein
VVNDLITPQDIHEQEFKTAFRGYDKDEVDAFLQVVADSYQAVLAESLNLKDRITQLENQLRQAASQVAPAVAGAVTAATSTADKTVAELLSYVKEISAQIIEAGGGAKGTDGAATASAHRTLILIFAGISEKYHRLKGKI